jgi:sulfocyanin
MMVVTRIGALALVLAGLAGTAQAADPSWIKVDQAKKIVTADLVAGWNPENGALNFNGYYEGDMTLAVPVGWTVKVTFMNHDGMLPHSMLVSKQYAKDDIPMEAGNDQVAISKAYTDNPIGGLAPNDKDSFSFKTSNAGNYWLLCGVPGHGQQGMYVDLKVDPALDTPEVLVAKNAAAGRP